MKKRARNDELNRVCAEEIAIRMAGAAAVACQNGKLDDHTSSGAGNDFLFSKELAEAMGVESVEATILESYSHASDLVREHWDAVIAITERLLEKNELTRIEIPQLFRESDAS